MLVLRLSDAIHARGRDASARSVNLQPAPPKPAQPPIEQQTERRRRAPAQGIATTGQCHTQTGHPTTVSYTHLDVYKRQPYPILHLLREASIDRAVAAYPDPDAIIERNIAAMQALGVDGFRKLLSEHD